MFKMVMPVKYTSRSLRAIIGGVRTGSAGLTVFVEKARPEALTDQCLRNNKSTQDR